MTVQQFLVCQQDVLTTSITTHCQNGRMFEQQQHVAYNAFLPLLYQLLLQSEGWRVLHAPKVENGNDLHV